MLLAVSSNICEQHIFTFLYDNECDVLKKKEKSEENVPEENVMIPKINTFPGTRIRSRSQCGTRKHGTSVEISRTQENIEESCRCGESWTSSTKRSVSCDTILPSEANNERISENVVGCNVYDERIEHANNGIEKGFDEQINLNENMYKSCVDRNSSEIKSSCENCGRTNCLTIKPTRGFYTKEQIAKHCTIDDCWIIAHGVVYDVTRYIKKHPGGKKSILLRAGKDASLDFDMHRTNTRNKLWARHKIGYLAYCDGNSRTQQDENCVIS